MVHTATPNTPLPNKLLPSLATAAAASLMLATSALAQSENEGPGSSTETFRDWVVQCANSETEAGVSRVCQMSQELSRSSDGQRVLNVTLQRSNDGTPITRLITPLGVVLPQGVGIEVAGGEVARFGFQTCLLSGCIAQGVFEPAAFEALRLGAEAQVTMQGVNGESVTLTVSLMGFAAAWRRLSEQAG